MNNLFGSITALACCCAVKKPTKKQTLVRSAHGKSLVQSLIIDYLVQIEDGCIVRYRSMKQDGVNDPEVLSLQREPVISFNSDKYVFCTVI
jgi:hypothetical protein